MLFPSTVETKRLPIPDIQVTITDDGVELISGTERRLNDEIKAFMSKIGFKSIETLPPSVLKV
jgi:hypothetical protein